jgi:hypothetical protein
MRLNKRAQEEMVGFVLVMVVVAVLFLVFLGISLRNPVENVGKESREVQMFLSSLLDVSSDCALGFEPNFADVDTLISECHQSSGKKCVDDRRVCDVAEEVVGAVLGASWHVGNASVLKGYDFGVIYSTNGSEDLSVLAVAEGNCAGEKSGASTVRPAFPGTLVTKMELCY